MQKAANRLSPEAIAVARQRRLETMNLQLIEGNPLDAEDIAMFEMFEREGWDHERCRAYIIAQALADDSADSAFAETTGGTGRQSTPQPRTC